MRNYLNICVSTRCMEFGLVGCYCCCYWCSPWDFIAVFILLGLPGTVFWMIRITFSLRSPLEDADLTHIEFPLPQIVPPTPYEALPVAMMVGSCSEAKRCAYCHEEFDCDSARRFCFNCGSATHNDCAVIIGNCSVFGCRGSLMLNSPI
jgi:hypothetical protein